MLALTEKQLRSVYACIAHLPPYNKWRMPDEYRVDFFVSRSNRVFGHYDSDPHQIAISRVQCQNFGDVIATMAHEMLHLKMERDGDPDHSEHKGKWPEMVALVCECFGWDKETF